MAGTDLRGVVFDTALGRCAVAWTGRGLRRVLLPEPAPGAAERRLERLGAIPCPLPAEAPAVVGMVAHAAGEAVDFSGIVLDEAGLAPFEAAVYAALRRVPRGATTTYGALAAAVGAGGAAREVGAAMARNPWPVVVPCHRVLAAEGRLGGFSAPGGAATKRRLLALEGIVFEATPELPGLFA